MLLVSAFKETNEQILCQSQINRKKNPNFKKLINLGT